MAIYTKTGDRGETGLWGGRRTSKGSWQVEVLGSIDELNSAVGLAAGMMESIGRGYRGEGIGERLDKLIFQLKEVQGRLFEMGAEVAGGKGLGDRGEGIGFGNNEQLTPIPFGTGQATDNWKLETVKLESWIDEMERELPELHNFILPGGSVVGAQVMVARAVCRRAERVMVRWMGSIEQKNKRTKEQRNRNSGARSQNTEDNRQLTTDKQLETRNLQLETILVYLNRLSDYLFVAGRWVNWVLGEEETIWKMTNS